MLTASLAADRGGAMFRRRITDTNDAERETADRVQRLVTESLKQTRDLTQLLGTLEDAIAVLINDDEEEFGGDDG